MVSATNPVGIVIGGTFSKDCDYFSLISREIRIAILEWLEPEDLINIARVSKLFYQLAHDEKLWEKQFAKLGIKIVSPETLKTAYNFNAISSKDLKNHSERVHRVWCKLISTAFDFTLSVKQSGFTKKMSLVSDVSVLGSNIQQDIPQDGLVTTAMEKKLVLRSVDAKANEIDFIDTAILNNAPVEVFLLPEVRTALEATDVDSLLYTVIIADVSTRTRNWFLQNYKNKVKNPDPLIQKLASKLLGQDVVSKINYLLEEGIVPRNLSTLHTFIEKGYGRNKYNNEFLLKLIDKAQCVPSQSTLSLAIEKRLDFEVISKLIDRVLADDKASLYLYQGILKNLTAFSTSTFVPTCAAPYTQEHEIAKIVALYDHLREKNKEILKDFLCVAIEKQYSLELIQKLIDRTPVDYSGKGIYEFGDKVRKALCAMKDQALRAEVENRLSKKGFSYFYDEEDRKMAIEALCFAIMKEDQNEIQKCLNNMPTQFSTDDVLQFHAKISSLLNQMKNKTLYNQIKEALFNVIR